jgi:hypothetical protein
MTSSLVRSKAFAFSQNTSKYMIRFRSGKVVFAGIAWYGNNKAGKKLSNQERKKRENHFMDDGVLHLYWSRIFRQSDCSEVDQRIRGNNCAGMHFSLYFSRGLGVCGRRDHDHSIDHAE